MTEHTPLNAHLEELNSILMELQAINVEVEDEDVTMILLTFLAVMFENLVGSLSVRKDYITLEEVKFSLSSNELHVKASKSVKDAASSTLVVFKIEKMVKGSKKMKVDPKDVSGYCKQLRHCSRYYLRLGKQDCGCYILEGGVV